MVLHYNVTRNYISHETCFRRVVLVETFTTMANSTKCDINNTKTEIKTKQTRLIDLHTKVHVEVKVSKSKRGIYINQILDRVEKRFISTK